MDKVKMEFLDSLNYVEDRLLMDEFCQLDLKATTDFDRCKVLYWVEKLYKHKQSNYFSDYLDMFIQSELRKYPMYVSQAKYKKTSEGVYFELVKSALVDKSIDFVNYSKRMYNWVCDYSTLNSHLERNN